MVWSYLYYPKIEIPNRNYAKCKNIFDLSFFSVAMEVLIGFQPPNYLLNTSQLIEIDIVLTDWLIDNIVFGS